ncbi:hypothetical protein BEL04_22505 [Mucilaginibacter sp. PPCGB 2223]|uniref:hypothetical protein n=1 Tax=Mucilaginibacter sp. PPCGB 2223 TaxID=1886027 RepID=UPI000825B591|nr:hypothetical protein [Mucilaginibacter sp. PPCGB 2223]OCX50551.1 hypothetical protein BEL04_22505 [Mucilaginibacter sp. PPCGB 2223]
MKKVLIIPFFLFAFANVYAQRAAIFKMKYLPGLVYTITQTTNSLTSIDFTGDKAERDKLPVSQLPIVLQSKNSIKYTVITGAQSQIFFSGNVLFINSSNTRKLNGEEADGMADSLRSKNFSGGFANGSFSLDSEKYRHIPDSVKQIVLAMVNGIKIDFPDKPLNPGDTFTQNIPVNLPIAGKPIAVNTKLVYKLLSTKNNGAFFDVTQTADLKTHTDQGDLEITGNGEGHILYDMKYGFFRSYQNNLTLKFTMQTGKLAMTGTSSTLSVYQTDISTK